MKLSHSIYCKNIDILMVAKDNASAQQCLKHQYSYSIYYAKVFLNTILNNFPIVCLWKILQIKPLQGRYFTIATAKRTIFATCILWESCLEFNFMKLSHSIHCKNIDILVVAGGLRARLNVAHLKKIVLKSY